MEKMIEVKHLNKSYGSRLPPVKASDNISSTVERGEFAGIMGPSDVGETTLMNVLSTTDLSTMDSVSTQGKEITKMKDSELGDFRRKKLGFISQEFNLIDTLNAKDNIPLLLAAERMTKEETEKRVRYVAQLLNIEELLKRYPDELSAGQRQRIAAVRAFVVQPQATFVDELAGSLDSKSATELLNYLKIMNQKEKAMILSITRDLYTASYCDRILFTEDGMIFSKVVRRGTRREFSEKVIDMQTTTGGRGKMSAV